MNYLTKKLQKVNIDSDWSEFSQSIGTVPVASAGITVCKAKTSTSVYLEWAAVNNADSYVLEYTTDKSRIINITGEKIIENETINN